MTQFVFALLDVRRFILLAMLAAGVVAISAGGPPELQAPVNRFVVRPITQFATALWHRLDHRAVAAQDISR